jgi:hypothetical protein
MTEETQQQVDEANHKNAVMKGCDAGYSLGFCWIAKKRQPKLSD